MSFYSTTDENGEWIEQDEYETCNICKVRYHHTEKHVCEDDVVFLPTIKPNNEIKFPEGDDHPFAYRAIDIPDDDLPF